MSLSLCTFSNSTCTCISFFSVQYAPCKVEMLELLLAFMVKYDKKLLPYAVDIKVGY